MKKIVASIEARMGSSRLPGKVLMDIEGKPALQRLLDRLKRSQFIDEIILATTNSKEDDVLVKWAVQNKLPYHRGSELDVLQRVVEAHQLTQSEIVVEITGDCPLIDPDIIDLGIETFLSNQCNVVTNCRISSYPEGADVQVFSFNDIKYVAENIYDPIVREHVSIYFYENPDIYKTIHLIAPKNEKFPGLRLQMDYKEDLELIRAIYKKLEPKYGDSFNLSKIVELMKKNKEIAMINKNCLEKKIR